MKKIIKCIENWIKQNENKKGNIYDKLQVLFHG